MIIKIILTFLLLLLIIMGIPSGVRLYKEAGGTISLLLKIVCCGIIAVMVITTLVIVF
jgi:hypothetical protein